MSLADLRALLRRGAVEIDAALALRERLADGRAADHRHVAVGAVHDLRILRLPGCDGAVGADRLLPGLPVDPDDVFLPHALPLFGLDLNC